MYLKDRLNGMEKLHKAGFENLKGPRLGEPAGF